MKILSIVGARPNFMKIAPFIKAIDNYNDKSDLKVGHILVHTGQHYDDRMSRSFFEALNIPNADINLCIGSGSHAEQVGNTMIVLEKVLIDENPDWVVVIGDVNAILAGAITAKKLQIPVCHIEAGLRSGDRSMPEEINRLVADSISDLLLTPDKLSVENLMKEGASSKQVKFVGNVMIDTLETQRNKAAQLSLESIMSEHRINNSSANGLSGNYAVMTLHRPSNVDKKEVLEPIMRFLMDEVTRDMPLVWPIHPRTQKQLTVFGIWDEVVATKNLILTHPLGYHELLRLNMGATIMLTDSGGLQEECTVLGTPCLTLRWNTERPVTLREHGGASVLVGNNVDRIRQEYYDTLEKNRQPVRPALWDGRAAERCLRAILDY